MPTQPAILGTMRLGNFRLGYESAALAALRRTRVTVMIAGVLANARVRVGSLTIRDVLNDAPNTAAFIMDGTAPVDGQDVRITINSDAPRLLFNGTLQTTDLTYEGRATQTAFPCAAIDDIARLNQRRPFGTWTNVSVTTIAQYIIATFAPGFTSTHVAASLPTVSITFDGTEEFSACLGRLATAIGGYFYVEDLDLHLFQTEATDPPDTLDTTPGRFEDDPPITAITDRSQLRTRQCGKGHGESVPVDVSAGETIIPIDDAVLFSVTGGKAIAGTTPDGAQSQLLTYAGVQPTSGGAMVGPGVTPSVAPVGTPLGGAGLGAGVYKYAYTWVTAAGETVASPLGTVTTGDTTDPAGVSFTATDDLTSSLSGAGYAVGDVLRFAVSFSYDYLDTIGVTDVIVAAGSHTAVGTIGAPALPAVINLTVHWTPPAAINVYAHIWVSKNGGVYRHSLFATASLGVQGPSVTDYQASWTTAPSINRSVRQVALSGVAVGPSGTTSRNVYRTVVDGSQLKLQQAIANNTATVGVTDVTADGSLGVNVVTSDTSGLVQAFGQVNAGSTSILTTGTGPFSASGGWFFTSAGELVRYSGISGNSLTGIPVSGTGAILTSVLYGSQVVPAPALTGVTGLTLPMQRGTPVNIWVERNDLAAQAALIALDAAQGRVSDGVVEGPPIVDERDGEALITARCDAVLARYSRPIVTVTYATRDTKTKSGKSITVNLANPPISQTLTIQEVLITDIDVAPNTDAMASRCAPKFMVTASSVRFSLEDLLRRLAE